jgi:hypothetical protein
MPPGATAFSRDVPNAKTHLVGAGGFQGSKPLNVVQHVEWIDHQRQFNSINIKLDYLIAQSILVSS